VPAGDARGVVSRVAAVPGVAHAAISSSMLGGGARVRVEADGAPVAVMSLMPVGQGFLETLGVPLLRGRSFDASELQGGADVAILGESGARQVARDGNAVGMRVKIADRKNVVVIGICRDAIDYGVLAQAAPSAAEVYVPYQPSVMSPEIVVLARLSTDPHAALRVIAAAAQTPPGRRQARPVVLSDEIGMRGPNGAGAVLITRSLGAFSILTLLLAASGVFAVISQSVVQRTRELGIRMALGAAPGHVLGMVLARETKLIGTAIAVGVVFTMALTRVLFVELTRVSAIVPSTWVAALALSGGVAAIAVALGTYRITRLEPAAVLRRL
jgi:putative ABC transport system permease protein